MCLLPEGRGFDLCAGRVTHPFQLCGRAEIQFSPCGVCSTEEQRTALGLGSGEQQTGRVEEPFQPSHADCRVFSARFFPLNHSCSHTLPQHGSGMPEASAALLLALRFAPRPPGCAARALIANALSAEPVLAGITRHEIQATK